ncbi:MAG: hypothetical protein AB1444_10740 [Spirochaetota bacterium]
MAQRLYEYVQNMVAQWGVDNPFFGDSNQGQLVEQWTTDLEGLEIFYSYVRNSRWVTITVLPTKTGIRPEKEVYRWKGYINEYIAETAVWWAFELLTESEARKFMIQHKPKVVFSFIRLGHPYELIVKFNGYCWVVED